MNTLLRLLADHHLDPTPIITHRFGIEQMMEAYDVFSRASDTGALKVQVAGPLDHRLVAKRRRPQPHTHLAHALDQRLVARTRRMQRRGDRRAAQARE